eukprot:688094-Amphidinium_carterae.1
MKAAGASPWRGVALMMRLLGIASVQPLWTALVPCLCTTTSLVQGPTYGNYANEEVHQSFGGGTSSKQQLTGA